MATRLEQLREGAFQFWVYRHDAIGCENRHEDLNGLALPPEHPFWLRYFPPIAQDCGCYAVGARFESSCARLGGDPTRAIPEWCDVPPLI
jgi:hypothetical protein